MEFSHTKFYFTNYENKLTLNLFLTNIRKQKLCYNKNVVQEFNIVTFANHDKEIYIMNSYYK